MKKLIILFFLIILLIPVCSAKSYDMALINAVESKNYSSVAKLLKWGANPNIVSHDGEYTPLIIAIDNEDMRTAQLLLDYGADPNFRTKSDMSPVLNIVIRNNPNDYDILKLLIEHGADFVSPNEFQYLVNPVSLSLKLKNYTAFNLFNEYKKFDKCDIAFFKMQGQVIKNAEHWNAVNTWKSCKMMPVNDSPIGLSYNDIIQQYGTPSSTIYISKNSFEIVYVNLYSKYVDKPISKRAKLTRGSSHIESKKRIINRCKDYKSFFFDNNVVVDVKNSEFKGSNSIQFYQSKI